SQVAAADGPKLGAIKGAISGECGNAVSVIATAADGRVYRGRISRNGRYTVKRLPAGLYEVKLESLLSAPPLEASAGSSAAPAPLSSSQVMVESGRASVVNLNDPDGSCVIVGVMTRIDNN